MIIDLHCHSIYSDDSLLTIENIAKLSKNKGIDGICITDHESFVDQHLLDEIVLISQKINIKIFIGAEINTDIGHIITFGINEYKFGMHRIEFLYDEVNKNKGALIWAHPYRRVINENEKMTKEEFQNRLELISKSKVLEYIDAIEVNNGRGTDFQNHFSKKLAEKTKSTMVGSSDCHLTKDVGTWATEFGSDDIKDTTDLIYQIKFGKYNPVSLL
jgi:predicted metal-dependent phosphoesterase TrpH